MTGLSGTGPCADAIGKPVVETRKLRQIAKVIHQCLRMVLLSLKSKGAVISPDLQHNERNISMNSNTSYYVIPAFRSQPSGHTDCVPRAQSFQRHREQHG
jgi:hypothetical protein